jgi:hypothetical protein
MSNPDIIASIRLYSTAEGGRKGPTPADKLGCMLEIGKCTFDCRLLLDQTGPLNPGEEAKVPVKFLDIEAVRGLLRVGRQFQLRELRTIGEGTIVEILIDPS